MFQLLKSYLTQPQLYEKTVEKFWNDPHISKGMLETHLNPNTNAASRKPEFIEKSVLWLSSMLNKESNMLDIGCGPGLYTMRLSKLGYRVSGLDFSERSIEYAKSHDSKTKYVLMNYLEMDYHEQFDLITLIWCDYGALILEDRITLLKRVYQALKPGGRFILDVFTPEHHKKIVEEKTYDVYDAGFWSPNPHIYFSSTYKYDHDISCSKYVIVEDEQVKTYNIWNTCFSPKQLSHECGEVGFVLEGLFSDVSGKEYHHDSDTLCVILKK